MTRTDKILINPLFRDFLGKITAKEVTRKFCCHDIKHLIDTARITYILVLEEGLAFSKDIVYGAALLHDIGRWQEYETGEDHALVGAALAKPILEEAGYTEEEMAIICQSIAEHRKLPKDPTPLGYYLHKGDKLSRPCYCCKAREECYKLKYMEMRDKIVIY